jgi:hypothetical protein
MSAVDSGSSHRVKARRSTGLALLLNVNSVRVEKTFGI